MRNLTVRSPIRSSAQDMSASFAFGCPPRSHRRRGCVRAVPTTWRRPQQPRCTGVLPCEQSDQTAATSHGNRPVCTLWSSDNCCPRLSADSSLSGNEESLTREESPTYLRGPSHLQGLPQASEVDHGPWRLITRPTTIPR